MRKHIILLAAFFCIVSLGYSQSLEDLGDAAFINGKYQAATEYYQLAKRLTNSGTLDKKIDMSEALNTEFDLINKAIQTCNYNEARTHFNRVFSIDPGNLWALDKMAQMESKEKRENKQAWVDKYVPKGFLGSNFALDLESGFSFSAGVGYDFLGTTMPFLAKASYFNYEYFPFTIDYTCMKISYPNDVFLHGLGVGSAYILTDRWSIDYGAGVLMSFSEFVPKFTVVDQTITMTVERYAAFYAKAGVTYRCYKDHLWFSYLWMQGFKRNYPYTPINGHFLVITGAL